MRSIIFVWGVLAPAMCLLSYFVAMSGDVSVSVKEAWMVLIRTYIPAAGALGWTLGDNIKTLVVLHTLVGVLVWCGV